MKNVHIIGPRPYASLPNYAKAFDAAILPFIVNDLTLAANPLKLREYLAAGLPVVSSAIPEAEKLGGHVRIGRNKQDFLDALNAILSSGTTGPRSRYQSDEQRVLGRKSRAAEPHILGCRSKYQITTHSRAEKKADCV